MLNLVWSALPPLGYQLLNLVLYLTWVFYIAIKHVNCKKITLVTVLSFYVCMTLIRVCFHIQQDDKRNSIPSKIPFILE